MTKLRVCILALCLAAAAGTEASCLDILNEADAACQHNDTEGPDGYAHMCTAGYACHDSISYLANICDQESFYDEDLQEEVLVKDMANQALQMCTPCMDAYLNLVLKPQCREDLAFCDSECHDLLLTANGTCTPEDVLPMDDGQPASALDMTMHMLGWCEPCQLRFSKLGECTEDMTDMCTSGRDCNNMILEMQDVCTGADLFEDNETGEMTSIRNVASQMLALCAAPGGGSPSGSCVQLPRASKILSKYIPQDCR